MNSRKGILKGILCTLYFACVATLLFLYSKHLLAVDDEMDEVPEHFPITGQIIVLPTEEQLNSLEKNYQELSNYFGRIEQLDNDITAFYNDVMNSPTCRTANLNFNELNEYYNQFQNNVTKVKNCISLYTSKYQTYLNMTLSIPKYSLAHDEKYNEFIERFGTDYETAESYIVEEEDLNTLYLEAKQFADDFFDSTYDLYCRIVNAEGGNQPAEEQYDIAGTIDNRIVHPEFPNTLYEVVHAPRQYSTVRSGSINKEPPESVKENMRLYLRGLVEHYIPSNVVYQALFRQGSGEYIHRPGGNIFCYY